MYVEQPLLADSEHCLEGDIAHRLATVLRMKPGYQLHLFNGEGGDFAAEIIAVEKKRVTVQLAKQRPASAKSPLAITLVQVISKGQKMDFTLQKAVELGVQCVVPIIDERSTVKLDAARAENKHQHWYSVMISAVEQSGRNDIPVLEPVMALQDWLGQQNHQRGLVLSPTAEQQLSECEHPESALCLMVGSEGGFSNDDLSAITQAGYEAVGLGPRILRTETAALVALSVCQSRWGDL